MSLDQNKAIVRRFVDEVLNGKDFAAAGELFAPTAKDQYKASLTMYLVLTAFPDLAVTVDQVIAEGDKVTVLSSFTGTHQGTFMQLAPTGKGVTGKMTNTFRIADGKIVESWQTYDPWGLVQQIAPETFEHVAAMVM